MRESFNPQQGEPKKEEQPKEAPKKGMSRRGFLTMFGTVAVGAAVGAYTIPKFLQSKTEEPREHVKNWREYEKLKPELPFHYQEIEKLPRIENLDIPGQETKFGATTEEGKMIHTLQYKNITDAVEARYGLPEGVLLALIKNESTGVEYLGNAKGDGGFGLVHTQANVARAYGLKTYKNCDALICNGEEGSCHDDHGRYANHSEELKDFIHEHKGDRKMLAEADERLQHVYNIDNAGRMIAYGMASTEVYFEKEGRLSPFKTAIARFVGGLPKEAPYNETPEHQKKREERNEKMYEHYKKYFASVEEGMKLFKSDTQYTHLKKVFEHKNQNLLIDGEKASFEDWLSVMQAQNKNFALEAYEQLPKYELRTHA